MPTSLFLLVLHKNRPCTRKAVRTKITSLHKSGHEKGRGVVPRSFDVLCAAYRPLCWQPRPNRVLRRRRPDRDEDLAVGGDPV